MKKKEAIPEEVKICEHVEECKASNQVLFYLEQCEHCTVAPKFKT
jgi:hypothetical protein